MLHITNLKKIFRYEYECQIQKWMDEINDILYMLIMRYQHLKHFCYVIFRFLYINLA